MTQAFNLNTGPSRPHTQSILTEYLRRRRSGEAISTNTLVAEHPNGGQDLEDSLRALEAIEQSGSDGLRTVPWPPSTERGDKSPFSHEESGRDLIQASSRRLRFDVQACLGAGGFGVVYLAHDRLLDRQVALKVPKKATFPTPEHFAQFLNEARLAAKLRHPHIVGVYDVCEEGDVVFMVMEYVAGGSLRALMDAGPLPVDDAVRLMEPIAEAVAYANQRGMVHRDLKPSNVLLDAENRPHVVDFGLAVHEESLRLEERCSAGTPGYMAPEQVRGETHRLDGRTDLWSLGVMLYEMLAGRRPFLGADRKELFYRILHQEAKPLRQLRPEIPPPLEAIVLRCLMKSIDQRFSTVADLAAELRNWRTNGAMTLLGTAAAAPESSKRPAALWAAVGLLTLTGAGGAAIGLLAVGSRDASAPSHVAEASSSETTSAPGRAFVDLAPSEIEPLKWYSLLEHPPEIVVWPSNRDRSRILHFPEERHVLATCVSEGLLSLGSIESGAYEFRVDLHQPDWNGGVGVFWGWHEAYDAARERMVVRHQELVLTRTAQLSGNDAFRIDRTLIVRWQEANGRTSTSSYTFASAPVKAPDQEPHQLHLEIQDGQLQMARWAGQSLTSLVDDRYQPQTTRVQPADHYGQFGLNMFRSTADFYDAEVKAHPSP